MPAPRSGIKPSARLGTNTSVPLMRRQTLTQHQAQNNGQGSPDNDVLPVPDSALASMTQEIKDSGGEWAGNPEDEGAIGWTAFDSPSSNDGSVTVLLPKDAIPDLPHQSMVRIKSRPDSRSYLAVVLQGPFAEPDGLRPDAPVVVTATVRGRGNILISNYHGRVQVEIIGEELPEGGVVPPRRRPLPNSPVFPLGTEETANVLQTSGEIRFGLTESHDDIEVRIPLTKSVLPRHLGVLGTTGGGKSTTVSGFVQQLQKAGVACVFLDTEGEYTSVNRPTDDPQMLKALELRGLKPEGVKDTHIYHLVGRESANPNHPDNIEFRLDFSELSPYAVQEILGLNDAQQTRFFRAYDACKAVLRDLGVFPAHSNPDDERRALELDEMEEGYPGMTLSHLLDIAGAFLHLVSKAEGKPSFFNAVFKGNDGRVMRQVPNVSGDNVASWRAFLSRLWRLHRLQVFDTPKAASLDYSSMLKPGRISIIDISDTDSPVLNNLVIAMLLRGVQRQQDLLYRKAVGRGVIPLQTMVLIEEAHEFLSRERIKNMQVLFEQVSRIARRGRKRWLGLTFITQLPQQLPDEVLGLINNWVLHKISDSTVVNRLRRSIGGIDDSQWSRLTSLAPGQAIVSFTSLARPLLVSIDPTPCNLEMVD